MQWIKKPPLSLVAIDMSGRYIKLLELERQDHRLLIRQYAIAELPVMVSTEGNELQNPATISTFLTQLCERAQIQSHQAIVAIRGAAVVTKQIFLNKTLNDHEMEQQAWFEASKNFPDLIEDLSLDFCVRGPAAGEEDKLEMLLVACRKTAVQNLVNMLHEAHFQADVVDVDYYALERALHYLIKQEALAQEQTYALLNFGLQSTVLVVVQQGRLLYAYDQVFDGQHLLQKLQEDLHCGDLLLHPEAIQDKFNEATAAPTLEILAEHTHHVLELFYSSKYHTSIQKLFLAGECAIIPELAKTISRRIATEVAIARPTVNMELSATVDAKNLSLIAPAFTLCCGLALHEGVA